MCPSFPLPGFPLPGFPLLGFIVSYYFVYKQKTSVFFIKKIISLTNMLRFSSMLSKRVSNSHRMSTPALTQTLTSKFSTANSNDAYNDQKMQKQVEPILGVLGGTGPMAGVV